MRTWLALLLCLPGLLDATRAAEGDFRIESLRTYLEQGVWYLDADIHYGFSDTALEALDNGVPLTLTLRVKLHRKGAWIWTADPVDLRREYLIRFLPLSSQYLVRALPEGDSRQFVTREAAIDALGEIRRLRLAPAAHLDPQATYLVRIEAFLDIEALPLPLRPLAWLKPSWKLSTGWREWPLKP